MQLTTLLERLKMDHLLTQLDPICEQASKADLDYKAFLTQALAVEWRGRYQHGVESRLKQARFPWVKTVDQFDFAFQPSIDRKVIRELVRARHENRLERTLPQLVYPRLLILDELGYLPLSREEASLFFRLLVRRYERASLIVTSNKSFGDWGDVFNDQVLATAILDRLLHHATTVNIKGESYRLREKKKAGLLGQRAKPAPATAEVVA